MVNSQIIQKLLQSYLKKYKGCEDSKKATAISYLFDTAQIAYIENEYAYDAFLHSIIMPLVCYVDRSRYSDQQDQFNISVCKGLYDAVINIHLLKLAFLGPHMFKFETLNATINKAYNNSGDIDVPPILEIIDQQ